MMSAQVGDDVFGDDPSINALEERSAQMFGTEAALFCPSGTMANQIAIKLHTQPGDEVICHAYSHIYNYEGGGIAFNSGSSVKLLPGDRGIIDPAEIQSAINADDVHAARSSLISLENTSNKGGGSCYEQETMSAIGSIARENGLKFHLDGARLWNALVARQEDPLFYGETFDTISVCFSKGMGCPVGSVLLGSDIDIRRARRIRKVMGGGMRQAGYLAAAGIYALENNLDRLQDDHNKAKTFESVLSSLDWIESIDPVETNIVIFYAQEGIDPNSVIDRLRENGLLITSMGGGKLRIVTHLDLNDEGMEQAVNTLRELRL
jgi:threonine aldolase